MGLIHMNMQFLGKKEKEFTEFIPKIFDPILQAHVERQKSVVG